MDLDSPLQTTGMSHALRYHQNLKVLRRRDPSITSIFDQFSHVCLYHHTATKWEKHGYEGSMFLYERDSYPPYGFYILNRMGMDDHIQPIYPEDTVGAHGSYLIIRSFPDFTKRRLAAVQASHPNEALDKFSDAYFVPDVESLTPAEKGHSRTIGLWMFSPDSRGPLFDTFSRLHDYIRKNEPYPQQFRFGPDRPPPSMTPAHVNQQPYGSLPSTPSVTIFNTQRQPTPNGSGGAGTLSDLDKLFAKLTPTPAPAPASTATSPPPFITGPKLLDTIFASASSSSVNLHPSSPYTSASTSTPNAPPIQAPLPTSRIAPQVLDQTTIAALLGLPPSRTPSATSTSRSTSGVSTAYSTDHSSSREGDDEDTSDSGYGYSAYSAYSNGGARGRGDGSGVSDTDADAYSESSTVLDPEAEWDTELQAAGASAGRPLVAEPAGVVNGHHGHGRVNGRRARGGHGHGNGHGHGRINGDVTPRPPTNGFITPPTFASSSSSSLSSRHTSQSQNGNGNGHGHGVLGQAGALGRHKHPHAHPHAHHHSNQSQSQGQTQTQSQTQRAPLGTERALVPFEPDSELWPYTRATTTGHSRGNGNGSHNNNHVNVNNNGNNNHSTPTTTMNANGSGEHEHQYEDKDEDEDEDEEQILELDFEDTSALSDPDAFRRRRGGGGGAHAHAHGNALSNDNGAGTGERKRVRTKRKMTRKERVAEHAREREEIERSWDAPAPAPPTATAAGAGAGAGALAYGEMGTDMDMEGMEPMSPELCPSEPELQPEPVVRHGNGNRNGNGAEKKKEKEMGKAKGKQVVYPNPSPYPELRDGQKVVPEAVRDSVVEAAVKAKPAAALERNEFVREVLTLIHTDRAFVDSLYKEYTSRVRAEA
ncbi:hypothetical protein H0H92_002409 [Tricholoma furcatifolium]|nr:hypothetical protein H0H92_002409 [Tricholoma furcatifolium]